jgi:hypothetical protein
MDVKELIPEFYDAVCSPGPLPPSAGGSGAGAGGCRPVAPLAKPLGY